MAPSSPRLLSYCRRMPSIEEYITAGLYDPKVNAVDGRLELLDWVVSEGFTIDQVIEGLKDLRLGSMVGEKRLVPGERLRRFDPAFVSQRRWLSVTSPRPPGRTAMRVGGRRPPVT